MAKSFFDRPGNSAAPLVVTATAFTATSTAAVQIHSGGTGKYVVYFLPTQDCYIRFGNASVGAADSSDWPLAANVKTKLIISTSITGYFRVIRKSADGTLDWYVAGRAS